MEPISTFCSASQPKFGPKCCKCSTGLGSELFLEGRKPDGKIGNLKRISRSSKKLTYTCLYVVKQRVPEGKQAKTKHVSGSNCFCNTALCFSLY